jgi:hypothetical protein
MKPITVGIREFRENLAAYLLESDAPVAITRAWGYDRILHPCTAQAVRSGSGGA